jgi:hypothetical protein
MFNGQPRYESNTDLGNERAVLDEARAVCPFDRAQKLHDIFALDYALFRGPYIFKFAEVKCRPSLNFGFGDGYYIDPVKIIAAERWRVAARKTCQVWIRFADGGIRCAVLRPVEHVVFAGRRDRPGDPKAMEPLCVIPWKDFVHIDELKIAPTVSERNDSMMGRSV